MEASGSSCFFAALQETALSDKDSDPHPARGLGAISLVNLPKVTLA
jgi:hypothetical protein